MVGSFPDGHAALIGGGCPTAVDDWAKVGHTTGYEHEPRDIGLKPGLSMLGTYPGFIDWLLQSVRKILDTTSVSHQDILPPGQG